ncbi:OmpA family protein [Oryzibacter oryziterrae]|uniref:OmpA family protein n=1 Tax=Oryzibacter oryziterrae TaxID=2766474 RepID=UPI001F39B910|nr:OmpA family protein [Oryzibacter oryziterrae]
MRAGGRRAERHEEEEESAFVSMTDMTVSFLFIVMILLAFFASQLRSTDTVPRKDYEQVTAERDDAIHKIQDLQQQIERLNAEVRDAEQQVEQLKAAVRNNEQEINRLKSEIRARDEELARKVAEIKKLNDQIAELERQLAALKPENRLETYLSAVADQRRQMLEALQSQLKIDFPDLQVIVSAEMDALRFKGDGLFQSGSSELAPDKKLIVEAIAGRLNELLPCFTFGPKAAWRAECNRAGAVIEAIQIEGHTDSTGDDNANLTLSTSRANATFFAMAASRPDLVDFLNTRKQPVLSVAGYGEMRPVEDNSTKEGRATNRRIDLRIIMYTPRSMEEIEAVRNALENGIGSAKP